MASFAEYLQARERNRAAFAESMPAVGVAFETSIKAFDRLAAQLRDGRDVNNKTHISLAPFFFIFWRQAIAAYDALSTNQAYLAWALVRPGIESALIIGKWVDDKAHADVWTNRRKNWKAYKQVYEGKALRSKALPRSDKIQKALAGINDRFLHPNPYYYYRHLELKDREDGGLEMNLNFFDDAADVEVGVLGILHLVVVIQDSIARLFANLFRHSAQLSVGLDSLEAVAGNWAQTVMTEDGNAAETLRTLGLWSEHAPT